MWRAWTNTHAGMVLLLSGAAGCAQAHAREEFVFGAWARSQPECMHPELTFGRDRLEIAIDADGQPATFSYSEIRYLMNGQLLVVKLGSRHPYSKTADREALNFKRIEQNTIALQKVKGGAIRFFRCAD